MLEFVFSSQGTSVCQKTRAKGSLKLRRQVLIPCNEHAAFRVMKGIFVMDFMDNIK